MPRPGYFRENQRIDASTFWTPLAQTRLRVIQSLSPP